LRRDTRAQQSRDGNLMILVDGVETALVPASDRGLSYGDGVFRTLAVLNGIPQHWLRHYAKLSSDCAAIGMRCPDETLFQKDLRGVCPTNPNCALKIIVTRGAAERGYAYAETARPTRIVLSARLPNYPQTYVSRGVKVRRCQLKLAHQPALAGIKHLNRLENVLARAEWTGSDITEGVLCDVDDNVIGGTMTNLFVVNGENLATPSLHRCGIAGVTRQRVLEAAARYGVACEVRNLPLSDVLLADEIFLVNSLAGIWPVREIDRKSFALGAVTRSVQQWLKQEDDAQMA
jgi:4-amino-4-deoxychorismate lyase